MKSEKDMARASRLFDSIGLIDDRFIYEAELAYKPASRKKGIMAFVIAAVSLTLVLSVLLSTVAVGMIAGIFIGLGDKDKEESPTSTDSPIEDDGQNEAESTAYALSGRLERIKADTEDLAVPESEIDLFAECAIIWKYLDEGEYRVCKISKAKANELSGKLKADKGQQIESGVPSDGIVEGVWIAFGDGTVISPYLEQTAGNVGYGEIFEYSPEYEPSAEFSELLCETIGG